VGEGWTPLGRQITVTGSRSTFAMLCPQFCGLCLQPYLIHNLYFTSAPTPCDSHTASHMERATHIGTISRDQDTQILRLRNLSR